MVITSSSSTHCRLYVPVRQNWDDENALNATLLSKYLRGKGTAVTGTSSPNVDSEDVELDLEEEQNQNEGVAVPSRPRSRKRRKAPPGGKARKRIRIDPSSSGSETPPANSSQIPVLEHSFVIEYTSTPASVTDRIKVSPNATFDIVLHREGSTLLAFMPTQVQHQDGDQAETSAGERQEELKNRLFILPLLEPVFDIEAHDFAKRTSPNVVLAAIELRAMRRAVVTASFKVLPSPPSGDEDDESSLTLQVDVVIALVLPNVFGPIAHFPLAQREAQRLLVTHLFGPLRSSREIDQSQFYSALRPAPTLPDPAFHEALQPELLTATLLPFQRRSLLWLLQREGKTIINGRVDNAPIQDQPLPLFWEQVPSIDDTDSGDWYVNRLTGDLRRDIPESRSVSGGILAEEVGLGKTVECISLILQNPYTDRDPINKHWDVEAQLEIAEVKATLIVTPQQLLAQWVGELEKHAPTLKVLCYNGWARLRAEVRKEITQQRKKSKGKSKATTWNDTDAVNPQEEEQAQWINYLASFDVVLVTYNTLRTDLGVARAPVVRPRRDVAMRPASKSSSSRIEDVKLQGGYSEYRSTRSPLVIVEWARVLMDEVQQVGGKPEEMVSLIPRLCSFAISGTPARSKPADLIHVIKFLRIGSAVSNWPRLNKAAFAPLFMQIFERYAIRTTKALVKDELTIPAQNRYVVGVDLGRVERHIYDEALISAFERLGVDARGVARSSNWELDVNLLRLALRRLRQLCIHPQVGMLARRDGIGGGTLRSITQVLGTLRDQNQLALYNDRKAKIQALIRHAQLTQKSETDAARYRKTTEILLQSREEIQNLISEVDANITTLSQRLPQFQEEEDQDQEISKGKGKAREKSVSPDNSTDEPAMTEAEKQEAVRVRALQARLRESKIVLHRIMFLLGDVYNITGKTEDEVDAYATAEALRKSILGHAEKAAAKSIELVLAPPTSRARVSLLDMEIEHRDQYGILTERLMLESNEIIDIMNDQATLLFEWKDTIVALLSQKLSSSGDEADGEEYARSLETQGQCETYLFAYAMLLADRKEIMNAERTALATHEDKQKKARKTKTAAAAIDEEFVLLEDDVPPEDMVLRQQLLQRRKDVREGRAERALKSVLGDLSRIHLANREHKERSKALEAEIAKLEYDALRQVIAEQAEYMDALEAGLVTLRKAFNTRILYFRGLQELSDSVMEVEWEGALVDAIREAGDEIQEHRRAVDEKLRRQLYLDTLQDDHSSNQVDENDRVCIICQCDFTRGFITFCAHVFCEGCLVAWRRTRDGQRCPVCRAPVKGSDLHRIALGLSEVTPLNPDIDHAPPVPQQVLEYNYMSRMLRDAIQGVRAYGEYGTKIMFLVRHLLHIQSAEPGAKSIVFSAWADSLLIIEAALARNNISTLRLDTNSKKNVARDFVAAPDVLVLLLHGERENAGLNVTCAKRVFLVEPVVNHAFEIQGIARVDRLGQTHQTEVFCYYAQDTVEKNILDLAARQGKSLYTVGHAQGTVDLSNEIDLGSQEVDAPINKKQKGDFVAKAEDMLAVLFPHLTDSLDETRLEAFLSDETIETALGARNYIIDMPMGSAIAGPSRTVH